MYYYDLNSNIIDMVDPSKVTVNASAMDVSDESIESDNR